jgi:hypothetical protein
LLRADHDRESVRHITDSFRFGPLFYVIALIVGFFSVTASLAVSCALAIYYALPSRTAAAIGHARPGHSRRV